jgi:serine beta-lactamase-like protein LACTB, mitochondrial
MVASGTASGLAAQVRPADAYAAPIADSRAMLARAIRNGAAPGLAVAVAIGGRVVWAEGFGYADGGRQVPVTADTRFGIGSISKTLTVAGALTLVDAGLLAIDAPLEAYLPDFPHPGRGVTLRRVAAHQSGLSDGFAAREYYSVRRYPDLESVYRELRRERLVYEPGTRTEYATGLFTLIGRAMERVADAPFPEILRDRVFRPAAMARTLPRDARYPPAGSSAFFIPGDGGFRAAPLADPSHKLPGAGFLSTAADLARFGSALLRPGVLSDSARREMFTPVPLADGTPTSFALGFQARREDGHRLLLQPGGGIGIAGWLALYPEDDLVVAILANATGAPLEQARRAVATAFVRPR